MGKVFISYAHANKEQATRVSERLESLGFKTWIDHQSLSARDDISTAIDSQIASVDAVLVLWSAASKESVWVKGEALRGLECDKYIGVLIERLTPPVPFNTRSAVDLSDWSGLHRHAAWNKLVRTMTEMSPSSSTKVLQALEKAEASEAKEMENLEHRQVSLFSDSGPQAPEEELDEGPNYQDVDALIAATTSFLSTSGKLELGAAITQAALDQEMLRDAAFVVGKTPDGKPPKPASCSLVEKLQAAIDQARDNDLIVLLPGTHEGNVRVNKSVRIVGLGWLNERPKVAAAKNGPAISFETSARLENVAVETRHREAAVHCGRGQPIILRCVIDRFGTSHDQFDSALYVAGKANPIVMATNVTSPGGRGLYFVNNSGGTFLGVSVTSSRGEAISCRGRPEFRACSIEAIGGHAVEVANAGFPTLEECDISGRGKPVVKALNQARPRIRRSRLTAIRQLAFEFADQAGGKYEANIVDFEEAPTAGTGRNKDTGFFGWMRNSKERDAKRALSATKLMSLANSAKPIFVSNRMLSGEDMPTPVQF